jgi:acyl carrier protein
MKPNQTEIEARVIEALQELLGAEFAGKINLRTNPIKDCGKDSEDGIELACLLSERFGVHIPDNLNPFVDDARHRSRTVGEIATLMSKLLEREEVGTHD